MKWTIFKTADRTDMLRQMKLPEEMIEYLVRAYPSTVDPKLRHIVWLGKQLIEYAKRYNGGKDPRKFKNEEEEESAWKAYSTARTSPLSTNVIAGVIDWALQNNIDLMRFTVDEAIDQTVIWHDELAKNHEREETESYQDPSKIVFRIENGWSVNKLDASDCDLEGGIMGHCVGGYSDAVADGRTNIYSLRDRRGDPHATIEMTPEFDRENPTKQIGWEVVQIQGKENEEPIEKYKAMLKPWFDSLKDSGTPAIWEEEEEVELDYIRDYYPPSANNIDEYGIIINESSSMRGDWEDMIERAWDEAWYSNGSHYAHGDAESGVDAIMRYFEHNIKKKSPHRAKVTFDFLEEAATRFQEKAFDKWNEYTDMMNWDTFPHMPDEDDFIDEDTNVFDSDGYNKAEAEYRDAISYYESDFSWYRFVNYLFEELNKVRDRFYPKDEEVKEPEAVMASWYNTCIKTT